MKATAKSNQGSESADENDQEWQESALFGGRQPDSPLLNQSIASESEVEEDLELDSEMQDILKLRELDQREAQMEKDVEP